MFELALLAFIAIRSSVRVADSIDLRLVPLNEDRAFVANMLVRAAFEMGTKWHPLRPVCQPTSLILVLLLVYFR